MEAKPPQNKKEIQNLIGKINFVRRFILNIAGKIRPFTYLVKGKALMSFNE
jgi:hypothetical protein